MTTYAEIEVFVKKQPARHAVGKEFDIKVDLFQDATVQFHFAFPEIACFDQLAFAFVVCLIFAGITTEFLVPTLGNEAPDGAGRTLTTSSFCGHR